MRHELVHPSDEKYYKERVETMKVYNYRANIQIEMTRRGKECAKDQKTAEKSVIHETIRDVREKFNLKDGDAVIVDVDCEEGKE